MIKRIVAFWLLLYAGFSCFQQNTLAQGWLPLVKSGGGGGGGCPDSVTFLARGTFDGTHTTAYQNLICGLNTDGIGIFTAQWDVLVILGTQNTTVAALNLPSTSFSPTPNGSPSFTADRGYTGVDASSTVYLDTNYNPILNAVNVSQDSAHLSVWSNTNVTSGASGGSCIAGLSSSIGSRIFPKYNDGNFYSDVNVAVTNSMIVAQASSIGHFIGNRSAAGAEQGYYNGSSVITSTQASATMVSTDIVVLASNSTGVISFGCANQISAYSIGASLTAGHATNFYNRLRTFGTALGWS